jgi:hypothetical protein
MYTHSPDPSTQYAILRKIRGSRDQAIPGYFAPQEQIPWERGWKLCTLTQSIFSKMFKEKDLPTAADNTINLYSV